MEEKKQPTKQELFEKDPDKFYHIEDLLVAVTKPRGENQQQDVLVNTGSAREMGGILFLLQRHCNMMLDMIKMEKMKEKNLIQSVKNKSNFKNFIRGKK